MTKSPEGGENEFTDEAKREAARTGKDVCAILAAMLKRAKQKGDDAAVKKVQKAQKYLGCRNIRKRRSQP
jgi:hypothetical protein